MHVSLLEWIVTLAATIAVLLFDVVVMARGSGEPTMRRSALALSAYCGLAVCFGIWTWYFHGRQFAVQFFAGWVTEYSLSVDNLFIFVIIMTSFAVPRVYQRQALFAGIVIALIFRGIFIALGAAAIARFSWVFYLFGAFLVYTALRLARGVTHETDAENAVVRFARNHLNVTDTWHGAQAFRERWIAMVGDPDGSGGPRAGRHRPDLCPGLHPRDLRAHQRGLFGVGRQRLRADGPAAAVLHRRGAAAAAGLPVQRARRHLVVHRGQADPARVTREQSAIHQRRQAH